MTHHSNNITEKLDANCGQILEQVGVAVITIDGEGMVLSANNSACDMFGYPIAELTGENISMLMPSHHAIKHDDYLLHHLHTGEQRVIGKGRRVEGLRADGSLFPMHLSVGRIEIDSRPHFTGIIHDLTAQEQLQDQATRFGRIIDESINEIFVYRADTFRITLANRGAIKNLGYELSELVQMTPFDFKPEFTKESFNALIAPLISGELERLSFKTVHQRKDGTQYDAEIFLHLSDAVAPPEFVAIVQDITERNTLYRAVEQAQKMESIGQLTGGIAHDFNNLLTVITGNLELLEMTLNKPDDLELVNEAKSASARGADLTSRLLSFARRSSLSPTRLNLNEVIQELSDLMMRSLSEGVTFQMVLSTELWSVKVDRSQIDSALMNLAINARDAMSGNGTLTIETRNRTLSATEAEPMDLTAGDYTQLSVSDTGGGIEQDKLFRVFEPFYTTKSKSRGHGLGLSMVYGFARQSGGSVIVESEVGVGSSFSIFLPRDWSAKSRQQALDEHVVAPEIRSVTILLVEDNDSVRRLTVRRLKHMGHTVRESKDVAEALVAFREYGPFDLLFTDMVLPGKLTGWDLVQTIRQTNTSLPIVISSGYSEQLLALNVLENPGMYVLRKPYSLDDLKTMISTAFSSSNG